MRGPENWFLILSVVGVLNAAIGATYYLRVIARMYFYESQETLGERRNPGPIVAAAICLVLVVAGGIFAGPMLSSAQQAGDQVQRIRASEKVADANVAQATPAVTVSP